MSDDRKLRKALELTLSSGHQLSKDAFEFLSLASYADDPVEIVNKALETIKKMEKKPLFIDKTFLEGFVKKEESASKEKNSIIENEQGKPEETFQSVEGKRSFQPFAKNIESEIKVIEDFKEKMNLGGTVEDYLEYFRDRFKRIERILRQRIDVKSATSIIEALKAPQNTKLKIIGMITDKREQKNRIFLTIEDLTAVATVLISEKSSRELMEKARTLLLDQVICLSVIKAKGGILVADDIILPEIAKEAQKRAAIPVYAVLTSDLHIGSVKFQREAFNRFLLWLNGKYGNERMREIAEHVKYVLIAGDIVDGIGVYPNQIKELSVRDIYKQYKIASKFLEQIPDYIEIIVIPGNHDAPRKALPQPPISEEFLENLKESRPIFSLGNPCSISLHGVEVLMYHGRSLDDIVSSVPGISHSRPEKAMTLMLQSRHLAPVYGGKTPLAPEQKDFLVIERVPDIFHTGHIHTLGYTNYRGVLAVNSGCWQEQTEYMKQLGVAPTPCIVPVVNLQNFEINLVSFI